MGLAILGASAFAGCETGVCTLVGCSDSISIDLERGDWETGQWVFELETNEGLAGTCEVSVPLSADDRIPCDDDRLVLSADSSGRPAGIRFRYNGEFQDGAEGRPKPEHVIVTIRHEGDQVAEAAFEPSYERIRPNGPDCSPTCYVASETLSL